MNIHKHQAKEILKEWGGYDDKSIQILIDKEIIQSIN